MSTIALNLESLDRIAAALEKLADMSMQLDVTISELAANTYPTMKREPQPMATVVPAVVVAESGAPFDAAPVEEPAPAAPALPNVKVEDIMRLVPEIRKSGKLPQVVALFPDFGIEKLSQLKPDQAGPFAARLKEIGFEVTEG